MKPTLSYDWAEMIDALLASGASRTTIFGGNISHKAENHYRRGVQPLHWRGELILSAWCDAMNKARADAPTKPVTRGHRVDRRLVPGPRMQALPQWPPVPPVSVKPIKRRKDVA